MNFYDPDGHLLDYRRIEELASAQRISLRTGCFCNPGAGEAAEGLTADDMRAAAAEPAGMTLPRWKRESKAPHSREARKTIIAPSEGV